MTNKPYNDSTGPGPGPLRLDSALFFFLGRNQHVTDQGLTFFFAFDLVWIRDQLTQEIKTTDFIKNHPFCNLSSHHFRSTRKPSPSESRFSFALLPGPTICPPLIVFLSPPRCSSFMIYGELHRPSFVSCFNEDLKIVRTRRLCINKVDEPKDYRKTLRPS